MDRIKKLVKNKPSWSLGNILTVIGILFAIGIGVYSLMHQVAFGWDQARDAFEALNITKGDLKLIGPSTDIPGVFHGVLWFYLLAIPYGLFHDPQIVASIFFVLTVLTIPLAGLVAYRLFKRRDVASVSMLLYAFSPLFLAFTRWLSNPVYTLFAMPFFLLSLWRYVNKQNSKDALIIGATLGIVIQSDFAFGLLVILLPVYFIVFRLKLRILDFIAFFAGLGVFSISYFLSEIHFKWRGTLSMLAFFKVDDASTLSLVEKTAILSKKLTDLVSTTLFHMNPLLIGVIFVGIILALLYKRKKIDKKPFFFSIIWLCNIIVFLVSSTGFGNSSFVFAPFLLVFIVLLSYIICLVLPRYIFIPLVLVVILFEATTSFGWVKKEYTPLSIQRGNTVVVEKQVMDYTYKSSNGKPFTISLVTNPLYIYTTWAYLYEYYGKEKYGYMPMLAGRDQAGNLGYFTPITEKKGDVYLIIEPGPGIYAKFEEEGKTELNLYSDLIEEKRIGNFLVQKRIYKSSASN